MHHVIGFPVANLLFLIFLFHRKIASSSGFSVILHLWPKVYFKLEQK